MTPRLKILVVGQCATGKSALIKRYCEGSYDKRYHKTIGVDYGSKYVSFQVEDKTVDAVIDIFDLSGDSEYFEIRNEFYRDMNGCLLVYDKSNSQSFVKLDEWLQEGRRFGLSCSLPTVLCANKTDLESWTVSMDEGLKYAQKHGMTIFETSAKNGENVKLMFEHLFCHVVQYQYFIKE
jgi:DnaJ family protein C protein 27